MVFDHNGNFLDDVEFDDVRKERERYEEKRLRDDRNHNLVDPDKSVYSFNGKKLKIDRNTRMLLRRMSPDNRYFLFEDRAKKEFRVYKLHDYSHGSNLSKE